MRFNIALSLCLSLFLIGGATWSRFATGDKLEANLIAVEKTRQANKDYYDDVVLPVLENSATSSAPAAEPLTGTDLVGRQLILDYVSLAQSGQADESSVQSLADQYVESIPTLVAPEQISYSDIKIGPNTLESFAKYSVDLTKIQTDYSNQMGRLNPAALTGDKESLSAYAQYALASSRIYRETAERLRSLAVPPALAQNHFLLINTYLSNASAMDAMTKIVTDPATGFAGMMLLGDSVPKEQELLVKIGEILTSNGV